MTLDLERTARRSNEMIDTIAKGKGISRSEALETPEGRYIRTLTDRLAELLLERDRPAPVEDDGPPVYLAKAAEEIAARDGISLERAYGRVGRERPMLKKRYQDET